uniref:SnoaL-like domain-containing protein n=1 Tax=Calcidiscus leptoporus TaxID=127549 RepID=A0A7S0J5P6_9EUKA|mmetsp:Transcript_40555/g.94694  ORF Transcript_40555/g.94694 Transcript_40555/m.94694 type:complete len:521 (+) Transcript_40555:1-1563(+)
MSPAAVAAACAPDVQWQDMDREQAVRGPEAVRELLVAKFPPGSRLAVERLSDGAKSGGFTWHREVEGVEGSGLRGITYVELNEIGQIAYVQEGAEPLFKLDKLLEALLLAVNANQKDATEKPAVMYERQTPTSAEGIVRYLWEVAYPGGATPSEALGFFSDDIVYEDFNYNSPFVGIKAVSAYIGLLDAFPQFVFVPERISEGKRGVCLTWRCEVNGEPGPSGISYNEVDANGLISFARDIPAPSMKPPPLAALAAALAPGLRVIGGPRAALPSMRTAPSPPSTLETLRSRPTRAAMALMWIGFSVYVAAFSPGEFSLSLDSMDNRLISNAIADPQSLNPIFFAVFNALGVLPAVNLALLLPGANGQKPLPTAPFVGASFALGYGALGPYLALREPRPSAISRSELGFVARYVTESKLYAAGLLAASMALGYGLATIVDVPAALSEFNQLFETSKLVHVSTIDFAILSTFAFEPIREDMSRRGWWDDDAADNNVGRLAAFCVPVVGPCAYLLLRPPLEEA